MPRVGGGTATGARLCTRPVGQTVVGQVLRDGLAQLFRHDVRERAARLDADRPERTAVQPHQHLRRAARVQRRQRAGQFGVEHGDRDVPGPRDGRGAPAGGGDERPGPPVGAPPEVVGRSPRRPTGRTGRVTSRVNAAVSRSRSTRIRDSAHRSSPAWL